MGTCPRLGALLGLAVSGCLLSATLTSQTADLASGEWRAYGGSNAGTKYSPLDQINKTNVGDLRVVWRQSAIPEELRGGRAVSDLPLPTNYQNTPLMVGGLLYMSTGFGTVAALDPATGKLVWHEQTPRRDEGTSRSVHSRGVAYWTDGQDARIIAIRGQYLVALNAKTGARYPGFGTDGDVNLSGGFSRPGESFNWRSAPIVVRGVIVVGGLGGPAGDNTTEFSAAVREGSSGHVRGYDVRTGKLLWTFRTIPRPGEFGNDTWLNDSWSYSGDAQVWSLMSADEDLGYVYLPLGTPTGDYYGGARPGNNLFAESLVCLDVRTGKRVWHFQAVHHGIWDYDFGSAPVLLDITVNGRKIKAVAQVSKQSFTYVFDRVTGEPVWPIEERPVPKGDTPGEWYAPTQPFPTRPPAYDQQGVTIDDLIDFTPALRAEAIKIISQYRYGPLFTPPSVPDGPDGKKGTIQQPGTVATIWTGAGADPETNILYVPSVHGPVVLDLAKPRSPKANLTYVRRGLTWVEGPQGLPIFKPPVRPAGRHRSEQGRDSVDRGQRGRSARSSGSQRSQAAAARAAGQGRAAGHQNTRLHGRRHQRRSTAPAAVRRRQEVPGVRQGDRSCRERAGSARGDVGGADDLPRERQAVHRRRHRVEGDDGRTRGARPSLIPACEDGARRAGYRFPEAPEVGAASCARAPRRAFTML